MNAQHDTQLSLRKRNFLQGSPPKSTRSGSLHGLRAIVPSAPLSNSKCPDLGRRAIWPPDHRDHRQKRHSLVTDSRSTVESMKRRLRNPGHQNKLHQESGGRGGKRCFAFASFLLTATSTTINTSLQLRGVQVEPHNTPLRKSPTRSERPFPLSVCVRACERAVKNLSAHLPPWARGY